MKRLYKYLILILSLPLTTKAQYFGGQGRGDAMVRISSVYLPIELLNFNAKGEGNKVRIYWRTASETNNDFFTIEKSLNGTDWKIIGTVKGAGNSTRIINYESFDYEPIVGIQYYRLKQTDFDGKFKYSKSVAVDFKDVFSFSIYPNPVQPNSSVFINLNVNTEDEHPIIVVVYDSMGREVLSKVTNIDKNSSGQLTAIDPSNTLSPGVYIISATSDNSIYKQKLIIR
ncbi:MAG: T9SS type A sorting domain-containing protein [Bacteroidia bacterium]|nr:T9SS type A sorting domain-containing protein [Bacteroidia bacterium]